MSLLYVPSWYVLRLQNANTFLYPVKIHRKIFFSTFLYRHQHGRGQNMLAWCKCLFATIERPTQVKHLSICSNNNSIKRMIRKMLDDWTMLTQNYGCNVCYIALWLCRLETFIFLSLIFHGSCIYIYIYKYVYTLMDRCEQYKYIYIFIYIYMYIYCKLYICDYVVSVPLRLTIGERQLSGMLTCISGHMPRPMTRDQSRWFQLNKIRIVRKTGGEWVSEWIRQWVNVWEKKRGRWTKGRRRRNRIQLHFPNPFCQTKNWNRSCGNGVALSRRWSPPQWQSSDAGPKPS